MWPTIRCHIRRSITPRRSSPTRASRSELDVSDRLIPGRDISLRRLLLGLIAGELPRTGARPGRTRADPGVRSRLGVGTIRSARIVRSEVDAEPLARRTRVEITASVHYVRFRSTDGEVRALAAGPVVMAVTHENYRYETPLTEISIAEPSADLRE
jgi:hypothetical protein